LVEFAHECTVIIGTTDGQTDHHDETNSRFSQFCEKRLKATKKLSFVQN